MKALYFNPNVSTIHQSSYSKKESISIDQRIQPEANREIIPKKENPWLKKMESTEEQNSNSTGFNWKAAIYGEVDQDTLKTEIGENKYQQYLKTVDQYSEGLISSKKIDKFI